MKVDKKEILMNKTYNNLVDYLILGIIKEYKTQCEKKEIADFENFCTKEEMNFWDISVCAIFIIVPLWACFQMLA